MEAKEEIKKLSDDLGIIGVYDYEKHKEWEWKQKAKEYVKDDLLKIEEDRKSLEEGQKSLEEGQKSLEEGQKSLDKKSRAFEEQVISTARKLLDIDFSLEEIMDITGFSLEKIESLNK